MWFYIMRLYQILLKFTVRIFLFFSLVFYFSKKYIKKCRQKIASVNRVHSMQNTALSFTERRGLCGATSSDHWSWHPLATSERDKVISYTVLWEQQSQLNSTSVEVTLLMSFCLWQTNDVQYDFHFVDVTISKLTCWFPFIDIILKISLCQCHFVDVSLLMSLY